ncbi:MAG: PhzF family phenazine biosynthesis protein [Vicinamibacterales bacterium]
MKAFRFLQLDVFTDELFGGNQLAVLPDARGITDHLMLRIAREMAFSETTFVLPAEAAGTDLRVRIFTPGSELAMAGHPTIGTAFALAHDGIISRGQAGIVFGEGVGPVPIDLEWHHGRLAFAWMTQPVPTFGPPMSELGSLAATIGLEEADIRATGLPVQEVCSGAPFIFIPVATRAAIDRAIPDVRAMRGLFDRLGTEAHGLYLFTTEGGADRATTYSRMFAPELSISEDPATGGACGPLGAYLVRHGVVSAAGAMRMLNLQGVCMQRPSFIHISMDPSGSTPARPRVGGTSVLAAEGTLNVPI